MGYSRARQTRRTLKLPALLTKTWKVSRDSGQGRPKQQASQREKLIENRKRKTESTNSFMGYGEIPPRRTRKNEKALTPLAWTLSSDWSAMIQTYQYRRCTIPRKALYKYTKRESVSAHQNYLWDTFGMELVDILLVDPQNGFRTFCRRVLLNHTLTQTHRVLLNHV